jgi:hypothetical protein
VHHFSILIYGSLESRKVSAPHLDFEMGETTEASPVVAVALAFLSVIPAGNLLCFVKGHDW